MSRTRHVVEGHYVVMVDCAVCHTSTQIREEHICVDLALTDRGWAPGEERDLCPVCKGQNHQEPTNVSERSENG